jgi:nitrate reductase assembly molybdenum cofactor insertion protein NarJ
VQRVAAALGRPGAGYLKRVRAHASAVAPHSGEAARQLGLFADRVSDLATAELQELHDETFGAGRAEGAAREAMRLARQRISPSGVPGALDMLAPLLDRLDADRTPFAFVVRALCCVLLARASGDTERHQRP